MKLKWIVLAIAVIVGLFYYQKQTAWREIVSSEGKFSVWMPGQPTEGMQKQATLIGDVDLHNLILEQYGRAYMASYTDFPDKMITPEKEDDMLDGGRDGAVAKTQGTLVSETRISLGGNPGRELKIEAQSRKLIVHARVYLVNKKRLYQLLMFAPKDSSTNEEASRFLDSFKLK